MKKLRAKENIYKNKSLKNLKLLKTFYYLEVSRDY